MAKYNWKKHKKIKVEFDAGAWNPSGSSFVQPVGFARVHSPSFMQHGPADIAPLRGFASDLIMHDEAIDFSPRIVAERIERDIRNVSENLIGEHNNLLTHQCLESQIVNVMDNQAHQGTINSNFEVHANDTGEVSVTFTPTTSIQNINITMNID